MVSRLDVLLVVGLNPSATAADVFKLLRKPSGYPAAYALVRSLQRGGLLERRGKRFSLAGSPEAKRLFWLVYFCFKNGVDYDVVVSPTAAEFVAKGLREGVAGKAGFDARALKKIAVLLSRHGFAVVESRKPFACRVVPSRFVEKLVEHFTGKKPVMACPDLTACLEEGKLGPALEKAFAAFKRMAKQPLAFDEVGFIHTSLSLEGNTLTLPETEKLLRERLPPKTKSFKDAQEAVDYQKALDEFLHPQTPLTLDSVLEFHRTAMNVLAAGAGEIRTHNVKIKGNPDFKTPNWKEVPRLLEAFFGAEGQAAGQKKVSAVHAVEIAASLHSEFQHIHPFVDGNSRTARAIYAKTLVNQGFPLVKIPVGFMDQYLRHTKLAKKRDDPRFSLLLEQITLEALKQATQKMAYA